MSNEVTASALGEFDGLVADKMEADKAILAAKAAVKTDKPKRQKNDKNRIEKLENDLRALENVLRATISMLNKMSSALGLPKSIIPTLD